MPEHHDGKRLRGHPGNGTVPLLFLCDHASNALPPGGAGAGPGLFATHIAYDIGAAAVTRALAAAFGAAAVLGALVAAVDRPQPRAPTIPPW